MFSMGISSQRGRLLIEDLWYFKMIILKSIIIFFIHFKKTKSYMVLLDYPNKTNPNKVYLMQGDEILYESVYQEEGVETPNFVDAYLAYSPAGVATG